MYFVYGMVNDEAYFHAPLSLLYKATQNVINNVGVRLPSKQIGQDC